MRWDKLFNDLETQLERELAAEAMDLRGEEERLRLGGLTTRDRLAALTAGAASAVPLRITLVGGERIMVTPLRVGSDWMLAAEGARQVILPFTGIAGITLTARQVGPSLESAGNGAGERIGLAVVLRDLCRRRRAVEVVLREATLRGTIDRVGDDHFDLAVHEPGLARRDRAVTEYRVVACAAVVLVRI